MMEANSGFLQLWQAYCDKKSEIEDLKQQRAELLEALKGVMYWDNGKSEWDIAREAITKAEAAE